MTRARLTGIAISPTPAAFAPLFFAGRLEEAVLTANDLGFGCVELNVRDPATISAPDVRALVDPVGLAVSAIATGQSCLVDGLCLAAVDDVTRASAVERFIGNVRLAAELGAAVILG